MSRIPVGGKFLLDDRSVPSWFRGTMEGSRAALISVGEYLDLGPIVLGLDDTGEVMRLKDGGLVPLTVPRALPGQPFHWNVTISGEKISHLAAAVTVTEGMTEIDLPTALREAIPVEDWPEWLVLREVVEQARDEAVQAAGEATAAAAGLDAAIQDAVDTKVPAAVDQKIIEIDLPALVGGEIDSLAGPAVQVEVDTRVDPLVTAAAGAATAASNSATSAAQSATNAGTARTGAETALAQVPTKVASEVGAQVPPTITTAITSADIPGTVTTEVGLQVPPAVTAELASKGIVVDTSAGTKVTVGGVVVHYDSGSRGLLDYLNGWRGTGRGFVIHRQGKIVTVLASLVGTDATANAILQLPYGFRFVGGSYTIKGLVGGSDLIMRHGGTLETSYRGARVEVIVSWVTDELPPTVLPGTPV